jgi:hypothetical protein
MLLGQNFDLRYPRADWADVYSILTQVWKIRQIPAWRKQEHEAAITLGGELFWPSLTEPLAGDWPPALPAQRPLIDPERVKFAELPDPTIGGNARHLWQVRQAQLQQIRQEFQEAYRSGGFDALLAHAFGAVPDLAKLQNDLQSPDPQVVESAKAVITTELHLTVEGFLRLTAVTIKPVPAATELGEVYGLLVTAHKEKASYGAWVEEEQQQGVTADTYWGAWKARLPRWRASVEGRQRWQRALATRLQPPLIDPDLVDGGYFAKPKAQNPAYQLHRARRAWVEGRLRNLRDSRTQAGKTLLAWFDGVLAGTIGVPTDTLLSLAEEQAHGHPIAARLEQLTLSVQAFETLLRVRAVLAGGGGLLDAEWEDVDAILVQVEKQRRYALWRAEERRQRIMLCADFFKLPEPSFSEFSPSTPTWLPKWRASWLDRQDWEGRLQSRLDQDQAVPQALHEAVSATEALTLPSLRDALVLATRGTAPALTERLLIDLQNGGEQLTTRISQAIETVQGVLWSLRTGQLNDDYPELKLVANDFDKEWQWLGSYATWRAAMLVFLYPENLLAPRLHRWKTPEFKTLIERSDRLTPEAAERLANDYAQELWDISALSRDEKVQAAACHADTLVLTTPSGEDLPQARKRLLHYLFALSNGEVYWSAYDRQEDTDEKQYPWMKVPGLENLHTLDLLGTAHHELSGYVYLFVRTISSNSEQIRHMRFDPLQPEKALQDRWERQVRTLPWPAEVGTRWVTVVCAAHDSLGSVVRLAFKDKMNPNRVLTRSLNLDGTGWDADDKEPSISLLTANGISKVFAVLELAAFKVILYEQGGRLKVTRAVGRQDSRTLDVEPEPFTWIGAEYIVRAGALKVYIFYRHKRTREVRQRIYDVQAHAFIGPTYTSRNDSLKQVIPSAGHADAFAKRVVWSHAFKDKNTTYYAYRHGKYQTSNEQMIFPYGPAIAPWTTLKTLTSTIRNRVKYRDDMRNIVNTNVLNTTQGFIDEAYFLAPVHLALQLQANGQYTAALDWFRVVYDYSEPPANRKVYYGLVREETLAVDYQRQTDWLLDPLDPPAIAATRPHTYTRYTLLSIIRCLLDYADAEFARDSAESVPRARTLYMTALELLDSHELKQNLSGPGEIIGSLQIDLSSAPELLADWYDIQADLYRIQDRGILLATVEQVREMLQRANEPLEERLVKAQDLVATALAQAPTPAASPNLATLLSAHRERQQQAYTALLTQPVVVEATTQVGTNAGQIVTEIVERRYGGRTVASFGFCVPPNPVVESLRLRAEVNLYKLRSGRNIAGIERQLEPYAVPVETDSGLPVIGTDGQLSLPGTLTLTPTPYRYPMLIERAKQLVQLAASLEVAMLSALEKRDAELYNVLKARQDIRLSQANVQLQDLRVTEAEHGVSLAKLQQARAQAQLDHYRTLLAEGRSTLEKHALELMHQAGGYYVDAALWAGRGIIPGAISGAISGGHTGAVAGAALGTAIAPGVGTIAGGLLGGLLGGASSAAASAFSGLSSMKSSQAAAKSAYASQFSTEASYERREQEWRLQQSLAQHDVTIGGQQVILAWDRTRIVGQERVVAEMQAEHAEDVLHFLSTKFTNAELYDWMSGVLEGVYRFFLQQATAMAQLAANQLAFERQNAPPSFIQADYWESPTAGQLSHTASNAQTSDRRGLTGSARLLQDIYQLDQYAFETDKRKLQLVKTISLSRLDPYLFQRFRETGVLPFTTPMELFDRDFPGHYLRLIKRVRTSVVALVPPTEGIHATLSTTGLSRVVIGGITFQSTVVKRDPETVALSSPLNASGLFELDPQSDMLYPFEGTGVDTLWEFRLPKAANRFDYRTMADVLITIEYTALNSFTYRQHVLQSLPSTASGDRPFSFRQQFADQWYDLHNPDRAATPLTVHFTTGREDFPPHLDGLRIEHVGLYFARTSTAEPAIQVSGLSFTEQGSGGKVGGAATSIDGIISTRRGNATSWTTMIGKSPFGEWELSFPDTSQTRELFAQEQLEDILLIITFSGHTPDWPL